jgi:hypothetical protein
MSDSEKPPDEYTGQFTDEERAFLDTYAMLLRLIFAPRSLTPTTRKDEAA